MENKFPQIQQSFNLRVKCSACSMAILYILYSSLKNRLYAVIINSFEDDDIFPDIVNAAKYWYIISLQRTELLMILIYKLEVSKVTFSRKKTQKDENYEKKNVSS